MGPINNPHDGFFKQTFGRIEVTRGFLANFLPADVAVCLDLDSLEPTKDSFVDEEFRQTFSDLVFTIRLAQGGEAMVSVLFEHKSRADELSAFQTLKYVVRIGEKRLRDGLPLCCVIPVVVYHGPTAWNVARSVEELVDVPETLKRFIPRISLELFDLSSLTDNQLRGEAFLQAIMLLLKYIFRDELPDRLPEIFRLLSAIENEAEGLECVKLVLRYVASGSDRMSVESLRGALTKGLQSKGESLMPTLAEQWVRQGLEQCIEQGLEQGLERGELIGRIRVCQELLGLTVNEIHELDPLYKPALERVVEELRGKLGR